MKHIESKKGLNTLLKRVLDYKLKKVAEVDYWISVIKGCIEEGLAMDEVDYENAPAWFRPLWKGLK